MTSQGNAMVEDAALAAAWHDGHALQVAGRLPEALARYRAILGAHPDHPPAAVQVAVLLHRMGRVRDAAAASLHAAALAGEDPALVVAVARLLRDVDQPRALDALCAAAGWAAWTDVDALFPLARCLAADGNHARAAPLLARILSLRPDHVPALYLQASADAFGGQADAAREGFVACLARAPRLAQAHWMLSVVDRAPSADAVQRLQALERDAGTTGRDRAYLGFALHNRLHAARRYDEAWESLVAGARAKRAELAYDPRAQDALFAAIRSAPALRGAATAPDVAPPGCPRPVFIVGMHRSGTTLLERMLAGHPDITAGGETYGVSTALKLSADHASGAFVDAGLLARLADVDAAEVGHRIRESLAWRAAGRPLVTEKLPGNFQLVGQILQALPEASVLHMVRDPVDTCFSNLRTYFDQAAPYSYDQGELARFHRGYVDLMAHWHAVAPGRVLDVHYDDLVATPRSTITRALAHCGVGFDPAVLDVSRPGGSVSTASMMEVRDGIRTDRHQAWHAYRRHLGPLLDGLAASGA